MLAAAVRPTFAVCCLFAACAGPIALPPAPLAEAPDAYVSSVAAWLPGHPVAAGLAAGAPDARA